MMGAMEKTHAKAVGGRIWAVMTKLDLTIDGLAEALQVHRNAVSNWVNGYNLPKVELMYQLTKMLPGLTLEWLYLGDPRMVPLNLLTHLDIFTQAEAQGMEVPRVRPEREALSATAGRTGKAVGGRTRAGRRMASAAE